MSNRQSPRPPRHPRHPRSSSGLRLTGEFAAAGVLDEPKGAPTADEQGPIPFPMSPSARGRLLAGVVRVPARPELASQDPVIGRIGHDRLVRSIEATLAQMQSKLDQLEADVDAEIESSLKFPTFNDDDFGPRAA